QGSTRRDRAPSPARSPARPPRGTSVPPCGASLGPELGLERLRIGEGGLASFLGRSIDVLQNLAVDAVERFLVRARREQALAIHRDGVAPQPVRDLLVRPVFPRVGA